MFVAMSGGVECRVSSRAKKADSVQDARGMSQNQDAIARVNARDSTRRKCRYRSGRRTAMPTWRGWRSRSAVFGLTLARAPPQSPEGR